jgi:hypothetical protein
MSETTDWTPTTEEVRESWHDEMSPNASDAAFDRGLAGQKPFYVEELGSVSRFLGLTIDQLIARAETSQSEGAAQ